MTVAGALDTVRETRRYRAIAIGTGVVVGLVVANVHWGGIVIGGMLVGIASRDLPRAVLAGVGFGLLVLGLWVLLLWNASALGRTVEMGEFVLLPVVMAIGLAVLGSVVRGVV